MNVAHLFEASGAAPKQPHDSPARAQRFLAPDLAEQAVVPAPTRSPELGRVQPFHLPQNDRYVKLKSRSLWQLHSLVVTLRGKLGRLAYDRPVTSMRRTMQNFNLLDP